MIGAKDTYNDVQHFYRENNKKHQLLNPLFNLSKNQKTLSWYNYKSKEYFQSYEEYYFWVIDNLQYSLILEDNAAIQIYFAESSNSNLIEKASLSFVPSPDLLLTYFRFDLDLLNGKDYYHNSYHINFGYNSDDMRLSLNKFPYPSEFIKFCLFLMGDGDYTVHGQKNFFESLSKKGEKFSHIFDFIVA